jgi:tRNA G18 (ribose-2'-O)-methylase SpoU
MEVLYGLHPVEEAVKAGRRRFDHVLVAREREDARLERLVSLCRENGVRVRQESREQLTQLAQTPAHQGVVAWSARRSFSRSRTSLRRHSPNRTSPLRLACCWLWMALKTRRTWALCCAWPMAPGWTAWCSPSAVRPL